MQIGEGWDNKVFLVNDKIIFRFPHRKIAVELISQENFVLNNLPNFSEIQIPRPIYIGKPSSYYPYDFQGYKKIEGVASHEANLSLDERVKSLDIIAKFLKELHSIDENKALALGAKPQIFDRTCIENLIKNLNDRVEKIITRNICQINNDIYQQELNFVKSLTLPKEKCLVHNDLDSRHLIFNHGKLTGIIDWGDIGISNKAADLAIIWDFYPKSCHQQFFNIYGFVDETTWNYARFLGIYSALTLLLFAADKNFVELKNESLNSIKNINDDLVGNLSC